MSGELGGLLGERLGRFRVVVMPDFFIDRIVELSSLEETFGDIRVKMESGGGSIHRIKQVEIKGGNASNVAYALGRLGVSTNLMVVADRYSEVFLRNAFSRLSNVNIDVVEGKPGYTVALEFPYGGRLVNVMLSDVGDVLNLGPEKIPAGCWERMSEADLVGLFNWAANTKGTELAEEVFSKTSRRGVATYLAPADPSGRKEEIPKLFSSIRGILSTLSINENEARTIAKSLSAEHLPADYQPNDIIRSAKILADKIGAGIDIHTPFGSVSFIEGETHFAEASEVERNICTGAGDVWDSANIVGYLLRLEPDVRLKLANAAAELYISSTAAESPTVKQVISFLREKR